MPENAANEKVPAENSAPGSDAAADRLTKQNGIGNTAEGFDPRFPRAFQPGFDGGVDPAALEEVRAGAASAPSTISAQAIPPVSEITPSTAPRSRASVLADGRRSSVSNDPADDEVPSPAEADDEDDEIAMRMNPLRNPFLIGLILLAVAFAAGGLWFSNLVARAYSGEVHMGTDEMVLLQMASIIAPVLLSGSVLTTVAILFFFAVRWSPQ